MFLTLMGGYYGGVHHYWVDPCQTVLLYCLKHLSYSTVDLFIGVSAYSQPCLLGGI